MVVFKPFNGLLPSLGEGENISDRISPPYDVIDDHELEELRSKPYNVTRITLAPQGGRYLSARRELLAWISSNELYIDPRPSYYLYRQSFLNDGKRLTRTGLVGLLGLEPYENGTIIPHEETIPQVKEDRFRLLEDAATHAESIFGLYPHSDIPVDDLMAEAERLFEFEDSSSVVHSFHRISDPGMISRIEEMMRTRTVMIADGHHRYETALRYFQEHGDEAKGYVMATMVPSDDEGMILLPTHRVLSELEIEEDELMERLRTRLVVEGIPDFEVLRSRVQEKRHMGFGLVHRSGTMMYAYLERAPDDSILWAIDAYACQEIMFKGVLGDLVFKIEYDESCDDARRKVLRGKGDLAILLGSPTLDDVWKVAGKGLKMPKKSTFFYPKIWSGFVYYRME